MSYFCLKLKISIITESIEFFFLGEDHIGQGMVLGYNTKPSMPRVQPLVFFKVLALIMITRTFHSLCRDWWVQIRRAALSTSLRSGEMRNSKI